MFIAALFTIAKTWKQPKYPLTDEWIWYIDTMEYQSAIKKNEIMPFAATWMDLEIIILSEVSQKEKDKYHDITYMRDLKQDTNELIYKQTCGCQGGERVRKGWIGSLGLVDANCYIQNG